MTGFTAALALLALVLLIYGAVYGMWWLAAVARPPLRAAPFTGGLPPAEHAFSRFHVRKSSAFTLKRSAIPPSVSPRRTR